MVYLIKLREMKCESSTMFCTTWSMLMLSVLMTRMFPSAGVGYSNVWQTYIDQLFAFLYMPKIVK